MNTLMIVLGLLAVCGIVAAAFRAPHARPPHFVDKDADGAPDMSETERRKALEDAEIRP